jgi:hypothetical protein
MVSGRSRVRFVRARWFWIVWTALAAATLLTSVGARLTPRYPGDLSLARTVQWVSVPLLGGVLHWENVIGSPRPAVSIIIAVVVLLLAVRGPRLAIMFTGTNAWRCCRCVASCAASCKQAAWS